MYVTFDDNWQGGQNVPLSACRLPPLPSDTNDLHIGQHIEVCCRSENSGHTVGVHEDVGESIRALVALGDRGEHARSEHVALSTCEQRIGKVGDSWWRR